MKKKTLVLLFLICLSITCFAEEKLQTFVSGSYRVYSRDMDDTFYGAASSQPYRTLVHSDYNYYYDGKGNLIGEGISNGGKISAACFVNSVESLTYIQNKLNEWGYPSYSYNIKGSVSTAFFRGH